MSGDTSSLFQFSDPAVRLVREEDVTQIISLFKMNYGDDYPIVEFYDPAWVKKSIYSDHVIWLVIEEEGEIIANGAVILDYGDYNDQIGEIGRLVVHPERKGRGLGRRIVNALFEATDDTVEFAFGEARTVHPLSQALFEGSDYVACGFVPQAYTFGDKRESFVIYINLYGNARYLRRNTAPQVIPEIAPLARHVLRQMNLPDSLAVVEGADCYLDNQRYKVEPITRQSLARLVRVEHGRLVEPLLFGGLTLDQGLSHLRRRAAIYLMAMDDEQQPIGAVGYQHDVASQLVKGIELVAENNDLRGQLVAALIAAAEQENAAQVIEVNISAYDPCLQQTFLDHGFKPVAYAPAMVFHGTERLDVVKMMKLNVPYDPGEMKLTQEAQAMVDMIANNWTT
jgi:GNAT superfamily N-acetyltransferase